MLPYVENSQLTRRARKTGWKISSVSGRNNMQNPNGTTAEITTLKERPVSCHRKPMPPTVGVADMTQTTMLDWDSPRAFDLQPPTSSTPPRCIENPLT